MSYQGHLSDLCWGICEGHPFDWLPWLLASCCLPLLLQQMVSDSVLPADAISILSQVAMGFGTYALLNHSGQQNQTKAQDICLEIMVNADCPVQVRRACGNDEHVIMPVTAACSMLESADESSKRISDIQG